MSLAKHYVKPVTTWRLDRTLNCHVRHVYGYVYVCSRDGESQRRATWTQAREDMREHQRTCDQAAPPPPPNDRRGLGKSEPPFSESLAPAVAVNMVRKPYSPASVNPFGKGWLY